MLRSKKIIKDFYWVGVINTELKVFDIMMKADYGSSYNSYILKTTEGYILFENVKVYTDSHKIPSLTTYIDHLKSICGDLKKIKYIVLNHTEPDHSGTTLKIINLCHKDCKIVATPVAHTYLKDIFNTDLPSISVGTGDSIKLGNKTVRFYDIPMMHWPDSMFSYIEEDNVAVTCDTLGAHYAFNDLLISKMSDKDYRNDYLKSFVYYFKCIMSPYKSFAKHAMKQISALFDANKIDIIATGHGPIIDDKVKIKELIDTYVSLSSNNQPLLKEQIVIVYSSAYHFTEEMSKYIESIIKEKLEDDYKVIVYEIDVNNYHKQKQQIINSILESKGLLIGTPTLNNDAIIFYWDLLSSLNPLNMIGKYAGCFGSYGWSGEAQFNITQRLKQLHFQVIKGIALKFRLSNKKKEYLRKWISEYIKYIDTQKISPDYLCNTQDHDKVVWKY